MNYWMFSAAIYEFARITETDVDWPSSRESNERRPYNCYLCGKSYIWKVSLGRHLREECGKLPQHNCEFCGRGFKQKSSFQRHLRTQHHRRLINDPTTQ